MLLLHVLVITEEGLMRVLNAFASLLLGHLIVDGCWACSRKIITTVDEALLVI